MAVKRDDVAALKGQPSAGEVQLETTREPARFFLSEGVRNDLEIHGQAVDPVTGNLLKRDKVTGKVTVTDRATGKVTEV